MENSANEFKLTYYVGAMLAHGGVLMIKEDRLVFAPRALERTMGATDTVIPFDKIKMVEVTGTITESLVVRTLEKPHRFVGSDPYKIRDRINDALQRAYQYAPAQTAPAQASPPPAAAAPKAAAPAQSAAPAPVKERVSEKCSACSQPIRAEFHFCPFCKAVIKPSCPKCFRFTESGWKFCAFCSSPL